MTWRWEEDAPEEEYDTLLTLDFVPHAGAIRDRPVRTNHEGGWTTVMDKMEKPR